MRDLALVAAMLAFLPIALRFPAAGAVCWAWFSMMSPHEQVFGFAHAAPLNSVIAVATLVGWLIAPGNKRWTADPVPWLLLGFMVWMTVNLQFGAFPDYSFVLWDRVLRIFVLIFLVFFLLKTKARIHAMVWTIVISIGFYGVKGGVFTVAGGGHAIVYGPPSTVYTDNNHLAVAVVTEIPMLYYIFKHTQKYWIRMIIMVAIMLQIVMVFGSYSRGGVISLSAMLAMLWVRSDHKILYGMVALAVVGGGLSIMPDSFFDRMHTVNSLDSDGSFQGRVDAWMVAFWYARDHFPFGAGYAAPQLPTIFHKYLPDATTHAAHSIYFQVLGEHGFIGLAIYLALLIVPLRNAMAIRRQTRDHPELRWAFDLADMGLVSLVSFYLGAAALSMAYADEYLIIIALMSTLRQLTLPESAAAQQQEKRRRGSMGPAYPPQAVPAPARYEPVRTAPDRGRLGGTEF